MSLHPAVAAMPDVHTPPSGEQWVITHGDQEAVLVEVGGVLRSYTAGGRPLVVGFEQDEVCPDSRGQVLVPWPGRVDGGRYVHDGVERRLVVTEHDRGNALHGLVAWLPWQLADRTASSVTLVTRLHPQPGWDWTLDVEATYTLFAQGLVAQTRVRNVGSGTAPFGYGAHPYLCAGPGPVDRWTLTIDADRFCEVDGERLLPVGPSPVRPVAGTAYDLRSGQVLGGRAIDIAYSGLPSHWVVRAQGAWGVELWADAATFPWVQVYTGDTLPASRRRSSGVAVEPMTCPPNALASGVGVVRLDEGQEWTGMWGIRPC